MSFVKIKNIDKAADRIKLAIKNSERIIIYGDSDCDGICSSVLLKEAIQSAGGTVDTVVFPNREVDGYGVNLRALELLKPKAPALFITLDLGIGNLKEIELANQLGFSVIVVDHHEILEKVPAAEVVVDPKQAGDDSGLTYLANVGVTFKLAEELLGKNMSASTRNSFLELVALATVSDMVPQIGDNIDFISAGFKSLHSTWRPGLQALMQLSGKEYPKVIACINAAESIDFKNEAYDLLIESSPAKAAELAESLAGKVRLKQQRIEAIVQEVERRLSQKPDEAVIFEGDPAWSLILAGSVASIISQKYQKPTFIYKRMDADSAGSVRSPVEGQNSVEAMAACKELLVTYGGHPKASGFRVKNENLKAFKQCLIQHFHGTNHS